MPEKKKNKTKITPGAPAGEADNATVHHKKEAKSMDEKPGGHSEPSKKKKADESAGAGDAIKGAFSFVREVKNEARKITWPPRRQVMQETWSVIVLVASITIMVLGFDYALGHWVFGPIEHFSKIMAPQAPDQLAAPGQESLPPSPEPVREVPLTTPPAGPTNTIPAPTTSPGGTPVPAPTSPANTPGAAAPATTPTPGAVPPTSSTTPPATPSTTPAAPATPASPATPATPAPTTPHP